MENARVTLASLHDLAAGVDHGEGRAVAEGHAVQQAHTLGQQLEDVSEGQEAHEDVVVLDDNGVAKGLQRSDNVLVGEKHTFGHASRARGVHDDGRVVTNWWHGRGVGLVAHLDDLLEWKYAHTFLLIKIDKYTLHRISI